MRRIAWCALAAVALLLPATPGGGERQRLEAHRPSEPDPGRTLRIGVTRVPTLDPALSRSPDQVLVSDQLFDSLTRLDPSTLEAAPSLAERWAASPDQRVWDFTLRPGARFSNERPITAADVKYTLERIARPGSGSPAADQLQLVSGYDPFRKGTAPALAGVSVPAPNVVRIAVDQPWAVLPTVLTSPLFGVVARESAEAPAPAPSITDAPVTSGPFRIAHQRGATLSLVPAPGTKTSLAGVNVVRFDVVTVAYEAFRNGDLDFTRVPGDEVTDAARRYGRGAFRPYLVELFYGFNMKSPKFADARFREAIVRGVNRRALVTAIYQGTVRPIDSTVIEGVLGYQEEACPRCTYDPATARALLAQAFKGAPPPPISLDYEDDVTESAIAKAIQASLGEVGITVVPRPRAARDHDAFILSGEGEVFRTGWLADYPSADAILPPLFASESPDNLTGFANPGVDAQLRAARAEANPARRLDLYKQADRTVMDQLPVLPIAQFNLHSVVSKRVEGLRLDSYGSFEATAVRVD